MCLNIVNIVTILKQNVVVDYTYTFTLRSPAEDGGVSVINLMTSCFVKDSLLSLTIAL